MKLSKGFVLPSPIMVLGGTSLVFCLSTFFCYQLYQGAVNDYNTLKTSTEAQQAVLKAEHLQVQTQMAKEAQELARGWEEAKRLYHSSVSGRLSVQQPSCDKKVLRSSSTPGLKLDATTLESTPSASEVITPKLCETLLNDSIRDTAQVIWLQQDAIKRHEASKVNNND